MILGLKILAYFKCFLFNSKSKTFRFYAPTTPGHYPIIIFLTGLDGVALTVLYNEYCTKLAIETNSIIVGFDGLKFPKLPDKEEKLLEITLNWTIANIGGLFDSKKTPAIIKGMSLNL